MPVRVIRQFYDHPAYLDAVVEKINQGLVRFGSVSWQPAEAVAPVPALEPFACHSDSERSEEEESLYSVQGKLREGSPRAIHGGAGAVEGVDTCAPDRQDGGPSLNAAVRTPALELQANTRLPNEAGGSTAAARAT